jgi:ABC-type sugar transport system substrate-binding protein
MPRRGIALFLRCLDNDYQHRLRDDALAAGKKLGFDVKLHTAQNDAIKQADDIAETLAAADVGSLAAVLVSPVRDEGLEELARRATTGTVAWVLLNREGNYLDALRREVNGVPVFNVTPDQDQIGRIQADQIHALFPRGAHVLTVTGPNRTSSAQRRLAAMRSRLGSEYRLTLLEGDWSTEGARLALDPWLEQADPRALPDMVCAQNDEMALGARQALRDVASRRGLSDLAALPLTGCDGSPALGQRMVKQQRLWATVTVPSAAGPAVEWLARWRDDGQYPAVHVTLPVASFPELPRIKPRG